MTKKQIERLADTISLWGTGCVGAGAADAVFGNGNLIVDLVVVGAGFVLTVASLWLTGKVDGDKVQRRE